jgi:hypothetical protein
MEEKTDLLVDETVTEILEVFDVPHAFPPEHAFVQGGDDVQPVSFWKRLWNRIAASFGFRSSAVPALRDEQRERGQGGHADGL